VAARQGRERLARGHPPAVGPELPEPVILKAAALAAYHSKKRNDTVCPVTGHAPQVRAQTKGLPDGAVIVEREKVVLVRPADWGEEQ
jgi:predicted ribosome quality control (RQC) complex YloA/Tae2 family protein